MVRVLAIERKLSHWSSIDADAWRAGLEAELTSIEQPTLVLNGRADKRSELRTGYAQGMSSCELQTLPGCNVLPWEEPQAAVQAIAAFMAANRAATADSE